jgi:hypothetical protein
MMQQEYAQSYHDFTEQIPIPFNSIHLTISQLQEGTIHLGALQVPFPMTCAMRTRAISQLNHKSTAISTTATNHQPASILLYKDKHSSANPPDMMTGQTMHKLV